MRAFPVLTFAMIAIFEFSLGLKDNGIKFPPFFSTDSGLANQKDQGRDNVEGSRNLDKESSALNNLRATQPQPHQYPFLVSIEIYDYELHDWKHLCAGSIISTGTVLTSQYCASTCNDSYCRIVAGAHNLRDNLEASQRLYHVSWTEVHPDYDSSSLNYDFGVIYTERSMQLISGKIEILELANNGSDILLENCISPGWGHQGRLQHVNVTVLPRETCASIHGKSFKDRMICGFDPDERFQLRELGGPLLCDGTLAGLGSWAAPPSGSFADYPAVFSDVAKELGWIESKINGSSAGGSSRFKFLWSV